MPKPRPIYPSTSASGQTAPASPLPSSLSAVQKEISAYAVSLTWCAQMARARCEKDAARERYSISQNHYIPSLERLSAIRTFNNGGSVKPRVSYSSKGKEKATDDAMEEMASDEEEEDDENDNDDLFH